MRIVPLDTGSEPVILPDLLWNGTTGDIAVDPATGDLVSGAAIETAVLMCLMTDCRVEDYELPEGESNRGWPGDAIDQQPGDVPLGSKLWLLRRRALTEGIEIEAQDHARAALQTLLNQQVAVRADVTATRLPENNRLELDVALYGRDGQHIYHRRFAVLWDQINAA